MAIPGTFDIYELKTDLDGGGGNDIGAIVQDVVSIHDGVCVRFGGQGTGGRQGPAFVAVCGAFARGNVLNSAVATRYASDLTPADLVDYVPARRGFALAAGTALAADISNPAAPNYAANRATRLAFWTALAAWSI